MNKEKNKLNNSLISNSSGITLISLIITIIVMLILAGVAISVLVDGDGLFTKTRDAADTYKTEAEAEASEVADWIAKIDEYLLEAPSNPEDTTAPTVVTLEVTEKGTTTFILKATGQDETGVAKYEFYIDDMTIPYQTVISTENTVTLEVTERTAGTTYECKVIVYDAANNSKPSEEILVTVFEPVEPNSIAVVGDFVNYSVEVDEVTYNKWRILNFDNNGHMEIVCYNGPTYTLGQAGNEPKSRSDFAAAIQQLNTASEPYKNGIYGYGARHLGSNPTNPSQYELLSSTAQSYIKYLGGTVPTQLTDEGINNNIYETDRGIVASFSGDEKLSGENGTDGYSWLASRFVAHESSYSIFGVRSVDTLGSVSDPVLSRFSSDVEFASGLRLCFSTCSFFGSWNQN